MLLIGQRIDVEQLADGLAGSADILGQLRLERELLTAGQQGDKAADAFVTAAAEGPFLSRDDLRQRSKLSKTVIDLMGDLGLLDGLPESNQLSLFDFA